MIGFEIEDIRLISHFTDMELHDFFRHKYLQRVCLKHSIEDELEKVDSEAYVFNCYKAHIELCKRYRGIWGQVL